MYINRSIDNQLLIWKNTKNRKPLLVRGARQIGKTSAIRQLGTHFKYFAEVNFDANTDYISLFQKNANPDEICQQLSIILNIPILENETLLFLDEIQTAPEVISMLRYFYEKNPNLHLVAAGSLLEFALADLPSFGVGRIHSVYMYPFSFEEFLGALGEKSLIQAILNAFDKFALPDLIHKKTLSYLKIFLIIGGMPEVVASYIRNPNLVQVQTILDDLIVAYQADFAKYKAKVPNMRILEVFRNVVSQVGNKYSFTFDTSLKNYQIKEALELLQMSGILYNATHSSCNGIPLGATINPKKRKYLIFDTGIFQRMLGLDLSSIFLENEVNIVNKGVIAELFVGIELYKNNSDPISNLFYWQRESKNSQAEVDYVIQNGTQIIPIEVKAGTKGAMQSMHLFLDEKNMDYGIRTSLENFGKFENIKIVPIYAMGLAVKYKLI
jgi:predicted AAA+ superfamily ATPase